MARVLNRSPASGEEGSEASLLDRVPAAVIASDLDGQVTYWNGHAEALYGWTRDEAVGRSISELVIPEGHAAESGSFLDGVLHGERWEGNLHLRRRDGSVFLGHVTEAPITAPDGAIVGAIGVSIDITERIHAERRVAARTAVTRALAEPAPLPEMMRRLLRTICEALDWEVGAIWLVDPDDGLLRCVEVWSDPEIDAAEFAELSRSLVVRSGEGLPGKVWASRSSTWVPDVLETLVFRRGEAAARIGIQAGLGSPIMIEDGFLGVIEFFTRRVEPPDDSLLEAMSVIGSQIGQFLERKEAQRAFLRSEAVREAMIRSALDCVISMDHRGRTVEFNPAAEATFGYSEAEAIGRPVADLIIPPELRDRHRDGLARYLETGEGPVLGRRLELEGIRRDGSRFPVELTVTRVLGSDPPLFTAYLRDITRRKRAEDELRTSRDQLNAIFQGVAEGITVQGVDGEIVFANEAAARTLGFGSLEELLTTPVSRIVEGYELRDETGDPLAISDLPGRHALEGRAASRVVRFRRLPDGEERWSEVKATPVLDEAGRPRFAVNIFHDITNRHRTQHNQSFLAEASAVLASSLDFDETLQHVARLAVPRLADWCAITTRESDGSLRQLAVEHVDPQKVEWARELAKRYPPNPDGQSGVPEVIRSGRPELYPEITEAMLESGATDPEHLQILRSLGLVSVMSVPMIARDRVIGAITFVAAESGRRYGPEDLRIAEDLAQRAAMAVVNSRLFAERSAVADALQQSLLPPQLPEIPRVEVAARYYAAGSGNEVGGDFYDVFPSGESSWAAVIGDVCGKGPEAAAVTGLARHTIRAAAILERRPSSVLATLNDAVVQQRSDHLFCTICYVRLKVNPTTIRATVCCAGHPLPILLRADGKVESAGVPGTLLGIFPDPELVDRVVDLAPGDTLVLYTDGVVEEQMDGSVFGRDRLVSLVQACAGRSAAEIAEAIERAVLGFRPVAPRDDIAILVLRVRP